MSGIWEVAVCGDFSAAHALRAYQGKCENSHGHNFSVEVSVSGRCLQTGTEFLIDFSTLKHWLRKILDTLDHRDLNATPPFDRINPTSENLAYYIYTRMQDELATCPHTPKQHLKVAKVSVSEKSTQRATWIARE